MSSLRAVNGAVDAQPRAGRCVVLAEPQGPAPALLEGLSRRGMSAAVVADAPAVMVELARAPAAAVILTTTPSDPELADLLQALRMYHPSTGCWAYRCEDDASLGRLVKVDEQAPTSDDADESENHKPVLSPGEAPDPEVRHDPDGDRQRDDEPLISQAEMAMLLGQGDDEDRQGWGS